MTLTSGVRTRITRRAVGAVLATALTTAGLGSALAPAQAKTVRHTSFDQTSLTEAKRVDSVPTPKLGWYNCYVYAQCATVKLPMDYDKPTGAKTEIALLRVKATDKKQRIGSLFLNPGGPGGSGTEIAYYSREFLSESVTSRFDIVGIDPRGTNFSDNVTCFKNQAAQAPVLDALAGIAFPYTKTEEARSVAASRILGKACSTTGKPLSASMSTAQVARDMDVLRRSVGDTKLNYLGFSYGSYLGQVYANMFPDRVRAVAIDGVIDPIGWAGTKATAKQPSTDRIHSADGAAKALYEILVRCDRAGGQLCAFAPGNPVKNFDLVANRLKKHPLVIEDPFGGPPTTFSYADLISTTLDDLYYPDGSAQIAYMMSDLIILTEPPAPSATAGRVAALKAAKKDFSKRLAAQKEAAAAGEWFGFPYDNSIEAFTSVLCTDGLNPADASAWPAAAAAADKRAKYFGRLWAWSSSPCASKTWTAKDEDAYRGSFTHTTINPVLVVGSYWDPATNYQSAVKVAGLLPNSRLLSSDNWGHTAYGTSECATGAIDTFLLAVKLPAKGTTCVGDAQPFTGGGTSDFLDELNRPLGGAGGGRPVPVPPVLPRY